MVFYSIQPVASFLQTSVGTSMVENGLQLTVNRIHESALVLTTPQTLPANVGKMKDL